MNWIIPFSKRTLLLAAVVLLFISCSSIRIAYEYSDWYFEYKLDNYFDLSEEQEKLFENSYEAQWQWHREHEVPRYIAFLNETKDRISKKFNADDLKWFQRTYLSLQQNLTNRLSADIAVFLSTITEEQVVHLQEYYKERNEELFERLEWSDEKLREYYLERTVDSFEKWIGDLTAEQMEIIGKVVYSDQDRLQIWIDSRLLRQKMFVQLLQGSKNKTILEEQVREWFVKPELLRTPKYNQVVSQRMEQGNQLILEIQKTITADQKQYLLNTIDGYINDLYAIHAKLKRSQKLAVKP